MKPKVLLSDLDGVLRNYPRHHSGNIEQELGLPPGGLLPIAFRKEFLEPAITGQTTDEQWRNKIVDELCLTLAKDKVESAIARWTAFPGELDRDVHALYRTRKLSHKVALLTNATTKLKRDLAVLGLLDLFHEIYNTSEIGFAKPDARTFHHVLKHIGHPAHEILFIDDRQENIDAAETLGFQVHLFEGHEKLRRDLDLYAPPGRA